MTEAAQSQPQSIQQFGGIVLILVLAAGAWFGINWWIKSSVVDQAIGRYELVRRAGDPREMCNEAENVVAAQLYAKREAEWARWKEQAAKDCLLFR